jgi:glycosyltransferase involved in cell wall biosynthesis
MKRVLLTAHKFFPSHTAGTELLTLRVAQELKRRNYEVLVVSANPPDLDARFRAGRETSDYEFEGIPVHIVEEPLRLKNYKFAYEYRHPGIGHHFRNILRQFDPSLVHAFHCQNLSASIIHQSIEAGIPVVLSPTDFWFICPVVQLKRPDGALCQGPKKLATNCLTCYTPNLFPKVEEVSEALETKYPEAAKAIKVLPAPLARFCATVTSTAYNFTKLPEAVKMTVERPSALRESANLASAIMVPTKLMAELFTKNGIKSDIIHHVHFGLDTAPLIAYQKKTKSENLRIGYVGTIFEHKGVDILIEAFQRLPKDSKASLQIYGDMNQFPSYAQHIRKMVEADPECAKKIQFCGTFPNDRLGQVLAGIDVLVVPSRWYENTPLVVQSAFATKTPVIATDLGGLSELVLDGINGFLSLNDANSLMVKLEKLLQEPALIDRLRKNIKDERTTGEMVDDIESVYEKVLNGKVSLSRNNETKRQ